MASDRFAKGISHSVWQSSGDQGGTSNWGAFIQTTKAFGMSNVSGQPKDFHDCPDFWTRYREDIRLLKQVGANAFRFSLEWSLIEPVQGEVSQEAIDRYLRVFDELDEAGIEPMVTLHHFVHPLWFEEKGGFTLEANVADFVKFAETCYRAFGHRVRLWGTFNEPSCASFCGWVCAAHPPGRTLDMKGAGRVVQNCLRAHTRVYKAIKALPGGERSSIGMVHHHIKFVSLCEGKWYGALANYLAHWLTALWAAPAVFEYFTTGNFKWCVPVWGRVLKHCDPDAPDCLDWWGVNYYSQARIKWNGWVDFGKDPIVTDMGYPLHPTGLYEWIMEASKLGKPMYITETGCADKEDAFRHIGIRSYMKAVQAAIRDGADVRGVYYWTLTDNFEWNLAWQARFGLFSFVPDQEDRVLRPGAQPLLDWYRSLGETVDKVQADIRAGPPIDYSLEGNREEGPGSIKATQAHIASTNTERTSLDELPKVVPPIEQSDMRTESRKDI